MGKAIIVNGIDFSSSSLGKVTIFEPMPIEALSIIGESEVNNADNSANYEVEYIPSATSERGVIWEIVNGSEYASINSNTGVLSVLESASSSMIKIRATSLFNEEIYAEKAIVVTYYVEQIEIVGDDAVNEYGIYSLSNGADAIWSIVSGTDNLVIHQETGMAVALQEGEATIVAISNGETYTKSVNCVASKKYVHQKFLNSGRGITPLVTDIIVSNIPQSELIVYSRVKSTSSSSMVGSRTSGSANDRFIISIQYDSGGTNYMFGSNHTSNKTTGMSTSVANLQKVNANGGYANGTLVPFTTTGSVAENSTYPIVIGAGFNGSAYPAPMGDTKIGFIVILESGYLKNALIPYSENADYGWKDVVTNKSYSAKYSNSVFDSYGDNINA